MSLNGIGKTALALALGCLAVAPAQALLLTASNTTPVIVDGDTATSTVTLSTGGTITGVTVELEFIKCANPFTTIPSSCPSGPWTNAWPSDIRFSLIGPGGGPAWAITLIALDQLAIDTPGGPLTVLFSDAGSTRWGDGGNYAGGTYKAVEDFEAVYVTTGPKDALGTWMLEIEDFTEDDAPLGLTRFTLNVTVEDRTNGRVPAPATLALLGLGLAGLGVLRRPR